MDKKCKEIQELLSVYLEEDLQAKELAEIDKHLKECSGCRKVLKELNAIVALLKNLPKYSAPSNILVSVNKKMEGRRPFWKKLFPFGLKTSLGTLAVISIAVIFIQVYRQNSNETGMRGIKQTIRGKESTNKTEARPKLRANKARTIAKGQLGKNAKDSVPQAPVLRDIQNGIATSSMDEQTLKNEVAANYEKADKRKTSDKIADAKEEIDLLEQKTYEPAPAPQARVVAGFALKAESAKMEKSQITTGSIISEKETTAFNEKKGIFSAQKEKTNIIIKNEKEWEKLWEKVFPDQPVPEIDFSAKMGIAIFAGEKPTGGYDIDISNIGYEKDKIIVKIKETSPSQDAFVTTIVTSPFCIKTINKSDLPIEFITE